MLIFSGILIAFVSCCTIKIRPEARNSSIVLTDSKKNAYLINKIDKKNDSIYVVYATKNDSLFKIVSFKDINSDACIDSIKTGKVYGLNLKSLLVTSGPQEVNNPLNIAFLSQHLEAVVFHGNNIMFEKDSRIYDIFVAQNLNGVCLLE